jgi:hypothetical protein
MGAFNFSTLITHINAISNDSSSSLWFVHFHTSYLNDPWTLPSLYVSYEVFSHIGMEMKLSTIEIAYQSILETTTDLDPPSSRIGEVDPILEPIWVIQSSLSDMVGHSMV